MHNFTKKYILPSQKDPDIQARGIVLNWILIGSICLSIAAFLNTCTSYFIDDKSLASVRLSAIIFVLAFFITLYRIARNGTHVYAVGFIMCILFLLMGTSVLAFWGILTPVGLLLLALTIIMAGILLGSRYSLYFVILIGCIVTGILYADHSGIHKPNIAWMDRPAANADAVAFVTVFGVIGLISWLFNRQMEHSLQRAHKSEAALRRQKALLEVRVEERTRELEKLQLEKMQQFYRFAELGRLSTSLFHDLANHLTSMNLDIEGLSKNDESKIMQRLQQNANYIDDVIKRVREQLLGREETERFVANDEIKEIVSILTPKAKQSGVSIQLEAADRNKQVVLQGSLTRFRQMIINLLSNAIDSYEGMDAAKKKVYIAVVQNKTSVAITVSDEGRGISPELQSDIFKPFYSTKQGGVGIGLFIVKQITEQYFKGTITLVSSEHVGSTFTIKIPKHFYEQSNEG